MSVRITAQAVTRETEVELTFRPNVQSARLLNSAGVCLFPRAWSDDE